MKRSKHLIPLIGLYVGLVSCTQDKTHNTMTIEERRYVDSIYSSRLSDLKRETDLACDSIRAAMYDEMVDSIMEIRLIEVEQIINDK